MLLLELTSIDVRVVVVSEGPLTVKTMVSLFATPIVNGDVSLRPPPKVEKLQVALHTKAKGSPSYRFYALYDKIYRKDVLQHAFHRCLANRGVSGVDGMTFQQIEEYGQEKWLDELAEELRRKRRWSVG